MTFTQKVMVSMVAITTEAQSIMPHVMQSENVSSVDCATEMASMKHCQSDCEMMSVVSVLHFIESHSSLYFNVSQLNYSPFKASPLQRFSETLYRPPFLS